MTQVALKGVIHGKRIELAGDPGLPDGQPVTVIIESEGAKSLEGLLRSAGACIDEAADLEAFMAWNRWQRKGKTH
jgi:hypothetical protein